MKTFVTLFVDDEVGQFHSVEGLMAEIDRQQNLPLSTLERLPRRDLSPACYLAALLACLGLLASRALQLERWPDPGRTEAPR